jgi:hypothetical protein
MWLLWHTIRDGICVLSCRCCQSLRGFQDRPRYQAREHRDLNASETITVGKLVLPSDYHRRLDHTRQQFIMGILSDLLPSAVRLAW